LDIILHATTTATSLPSVIPVDISQTVYGTSVNTSTLLLVPNEATDTHGINVAGLDTAVNRSSIHRVFTLGDDAGHLAYIARPIESIPPAISFITSSIGIASQCLPITHQCFPPSLLETNMSWYPPDAKFDCTPAGYPEYRHLGTKTSNISIADAFSVPFSQLSASTDNPGGLVRSLKQNPFTAVYQRHMTRIDYPFETSLVEMLGPGTGVGRFIIMACNMSVYNVTLRFTSGSYSLVNASLLDPSIAAFATHPLVSNGENSLETYYSSGYREKLDVSYPIVARLSSDIQYSILFVKELR
jgi:hypothetical protein